MKYRKRGHAAWKVVSGVLAVLVAGGAGAVAYLANEYDPKVLPGTVFAGEVPLADMSEANARKAVMDWWETKRTETLRFAKGPLEKAPEPATLDEMGVGLDTEAVMEAVRYDTFWDGFRSSLGSASTAEARVIEPVYTFGEGKAASLRAFVDEHQPPIRKATVVWLDGEVKRTPESNGMALDEAALVEAVSAAVAGDGLVELPLKEAPKRVSNEDLAKISTVVSEFSTKFNAGQISRSANIKLAAEMIDGLVLLPGESFSFNDHLGQRTKAKGFKEAGVYVSGRHDIDVGGGICQVSTTLYNALLLGEMQVDTRFPHSLPVPYVPLGRDAAVSFPAPDLKFTNNYSTPVAVSATYAPGVVTFRILGEKKHHREVKFESKLLSSWSHGEKLVHDPSLPFGKRKVMDKGGAGRKVQTWKVVYEDGKEVERIDLGASTYRGGPVIVAVNKTAKAPATSAPPEPSDGPGDGGADALSSGE